MKIVLQVVPYMGGFEHTHACSKGVLIGSSIKKSFYFYTSGLQHHKLSLRSSPR